MAEQRGFEDLECYQLALQVMQEAYAVIRRLPPQEKYNLDPQMRKCSVSGVQNIAEGYGRYHYLDSIRFFYIARGSLAETLSAFIVCDTLGYTTGELPRQRDLCHQAIRSLSGYIRYVRTQKQGHQEYGDRVLREDRPTYDIAINPFDDIDPGDETDQSTNLPIYQSTPPRRLRMTNNSSRTAVVAVGGNALILDKQHEDVASQVSAVEQTCKHIADMIERGWNVIVTHGNGPQVGFILRRNELAAHEVHSTPLDVIGADTQGAIGYMIARSLDNEFTQRGIKRSVAAVVTQVLVDRNDSGFTNPTKGIGGFTTEDKARQFEQEGWMVKEDAGRGWRRMIASPIPLEIVEQDAIQTLIEAGFIVVGVGGGGIPVIEDEHGMLKGVFAVIDKDRASALLAANLHADLLLISTAVEKVAINFNKPNQQWLDKMTLSEAKQYAAAGHFLAGSMGPKIEAIIAFLEANPNGKGLITDPPHMVDALDGKTGTWIVAE